MKTKKNKLTISIVLVVILSLSSLLLVGFGINKNKTPNEMYAVYLDGNKIGTVKSKDDFNEYINKQEETLKKQYDVEEIYTPKGAKKYYEEINQPLVVSFIAFYICFYIDRSR